MRGEARRAICDLDLRQPGVRPVSDVARGADFFFAKSVGGGRMARGARRW